MSEDSFKRVSMVTNFGADKISGNIFSLNVRLDEQNKVK
jgi:hypothetical protein